jgi:hypothetical protein
MVQRKEGGFAGFINGVVHVWHQSSNGKWIRQPIQGMRGLPGKKPSGNRITWYQRLQQEGLLFLASPKPTTYTKRYTKSGREVRKPSNWSQEQGTGHYALQGANNSLTKGRPVDAPNDYDRNYQPWKGGRAGDKTSIIKHDKLME